ncbi:unnamed protein product [Lampetra planeri]
MLEQGMEASGQDKSHDGDEGSLQMQEGDGSGADDHTAVAIASVQQATAFNDPSIQYQFRTESSDGQVTYRVVQVDSQGEGQTTVSWLLQGRAETRTHMVDCNLICNPFISTYKTKVCVCCNGCSTVVGVCARVIDVWLCTLHGLKSCAGKFTRVRMCQFYVMMAPQDVLQGGAQRPIAPRTHPYTPKLEGPRTPRDERRRAQHNEVERRRRDKINNWIVELSKYIPDCANDHTKSVQSKGGVLSKACEYIQELRQTNQRMEEELKEAERTQLEHELLMQQFEELKNESALLRTQLQQHGIEVVGSVPGQ